MDLKQVCTLCLTVNQNSRRCFCCNARGCVNCISGHTARQFPTCCRCFAVAQKFESMCAECQNNYANWVLREFNSGANKRMFSSNSEALTAYAPKITRFIRKGREEYSKQFTRSNFPPQS